jgi:hypothetical protein
MIAGIGRHFATFLVRTPTLPAAAIIIATCSRKTRFRRSCYDHAEN